MLNKYVKRKILDKKLINTVAKLELEIIDGIDLVPKVLLINALGLENCS